MFGLPELIVVLLFSGFYLIPLAAGIWALITLYRIRAAQEELGRKIDVIDRHVRGGTATS